MGVYAICGEKTYSGCLIFQALASIVRHVSRCFRRADAMLWLRWLLPVTLVFFALIVFASPAMVRADSDKTARAKKFIDEHIAKIRPLEIAVSLAWWNANTMGKDTDFEVKKQA